MNRAMQVVSSVLFVSVCVFGWILLRDEGEPDLPARPPVAPAAPAAPARVEVLTSSSRSIQGETYLAKKSDFDAEVERRRLVVQTPDRAADELFTVVDRRASGDFPSLVAGATELALAMGVFQSYQAEAVRVAERRLVSASGARRAALIEALAAIGGPDAATALGKVDFATLTAQELRAVARLATTLEPEAGDDLKQRLRQQASPKLMLELDAPSEQNGMK
ncbi:MAG: hypothetical protein K8T90_04220 [Planctomycetes bacterium]|nr:hypothetical protein [Planctomycetota bacterium]